MIRFGADTEDEVFITHEAAARGVEIENTGSEPLVGCATSARCAWNLRIVHRRNLASKIRTTTRRARRVININCFVYVVSSWCN